jgi:VanZ family protein
MRPLIRSAALASILLIVVLSLIPKEFEVRTNIAGNHEHAIAYAISGALLAVAYPAANRWLIAVALFVLSAAFEVLQNFIPGRSPEIAGAVFSGAGAVAGVVVVSLVTSLRPSLPPLSRKH